MGLHVDRIYCSSSQEPPDQEFSDVVVFLNNGEQFIASFFTYGYLKAMLLQFQENGKNLHGAYFWKKNMVLVDECSQQAVRLVVQNLLDEGEFLEAFEKI